MATCIRKEFLIEIFLNSIFFQKLISEAGLCEKFTLVTKVIWIFNFIWNWLNEFLSNFAHSFGIVMVTCIQKEFLIEIFLTPFFAKIDFRSWTLKNLLLWLKWYEFLAQTKSSSIRGVNCCSCCCCCCCCCCC